MAADVPYPSILLGGLGTFCDLCNPAVFTFGAWGSVERVLTSSLDETLPEAETEAQSSTHDA